MRPSCKSKEEVITRDTLSLKKSRASKPNVIDKQDPPSSPSGNEYTSRDVNDTLVNVQRSAFTGHQTVDKENVSPHYFLMHTQPAVRRPSAAHGDRTSPLAETKNWKSKSSLKKLCQDFVSLCSSTTSPTSDERLCLDTLAFKLGVKRRRLYDVVNVLESVGIVERQANTKYIWRGLSNVPRTLLHLKHNNNNNNNNNVSQSSTYQPSETRKERSLVHLARCFLQLFFDAKSSGLVTLDEAVCILHQRDIAKHRSNPDTLRRRLYDISNILIGVGLIEKVDNASTAKKPCFRWIDNINSTSDSFSTKVSLKKRDDALLRSRYHAIRSSPDDTLEFCLPNSLKRLSFTFPPSPPQPLAALVPAVPPSQNLIPSAHLTANATATPSCSSNSADSALTSSVMSQRLSGKRRHECNEADNNDKINNKRLKLLADVTSPHDEYL